MGILSNPPDEILSEIVKIIVYGFKIIGLAPFSLRQTRELARSFRSSYGIGVFSFSKIGLLYNILLLILVLVMSWLAIPRLVLMSYPNKSSITQAIDLTLGIVRTVTSCVIIVFWGLRQKTAAFIMNRLSKVSRLLSGMKKHQHVERVWFKFSVLFIIVNIILWITFCTTVEVFFNTIPDWFIANVPPFVINWFVVEYSIILEVTARELESVNNDLMNFNEFPNHTFRTPLLNSNRITVLQGLQSHSEVTAIKLLHSIRTTLFEVSLDIANFFSLPMLPSIACFFLTLVYNIHYLLTPIVAPIDGRALSVTDDVNTLSWIGINIYPLVLLASNVMKTLTELEKTGLIVHKLLITTRREEIETELELFSNELLHEHVNFTAFGFFTLDFTLIQSIFGATATYLIIIIQFMRSANT